MLFSTPLASLLLLLAAAPSFSSANVNIHSSPSRDRRHRSLSLKHRATNTAGGWTSLGCTQDGSARALTGYTVDLGAGATIEGGLLVCQKKGFSLAGLQYIVEELVLTFVCQICLIVRSGSQLFCGNSFANSLGGTISSSSCSSPCLGNPSETCGGMYTSSTYSLSSSSNSLPTGWASFGCTQDGWSRALNGYEFEDGSKMTVELCLSTCEGKGFAIAALEYGSQCRCGNWFENGMGGILDLSVCSMSCSGNPAETCGSSYVASTYILLSSGGSSDGTSTVFSTRTTTVTTTLTTITSASTSSAAASPSSSSSSVASGWTYLGCSQDGSLRALTGYSVDLGSSATIAGCLRVCAGKGYGMAGIQYGSQCYCDSAFRNSLGAIVSDSQCSSTCSGDASTKCGGSYLNSVYTNAALLSSSSSSATKTSSSSSAVASASSAGLPSGWSVVGCTQDGDARALTGSSVDLGSSATVESCLAVCRSGGFVLAGLQYGSQCMCGSSFSNNLGAVISSSSCSMTCKGNTLQLCGGFYTTNTYRYTPSLSSSSASRTSTSVSASASASSVVLPTGWTTVGCTQDGDARALTGSSTDLGNSATVEACLAVCLKGGFVLAGLQYGSQCMCGSTFSNNLGSVISSSSCSTPCKGNALQLCGGFYTTNTYRYTLSLSSSVPISSTRVSTRISSSSSIASSTASSTTSSSAVPTPSPTYVYQGCAQDYPWDPMAGRTLTGSYTQDPKMTNQMCWSICAKGGFALAGTQSFNECWCGNILDNGNGAPASEGDCNQSCVGDSSQKCGGGWRLSIYRSPTFPAWKLTQSAAGNSFFDNWNWYDGVDPTKGFVDYLSKADAYKYGLAYVSSSGNAIMKMETTPVVDAAVGRKSTRIGTNWRFNSNSLLVLDVVHMPIGCGIWPAAWLLGDGDWPYTGEVDILEGIGFYSNNQASVHTGSGCYIPTLFGGTGSLAITNCAAYETGNQGCGIVDDSGSPNYGVSFNNNGGGVYAMSWTDSAISIYFFPRNAIPADIASGSPDPDTGKWGQPVARYPGTYCTLSKFFKNLNAIINITTSLKLTTFSSRSAETGLEALGPRANLSLVSLLRVQLSQASRLARSTFEREEVISPRLTGRSSPSSSTRSSLVPSSLLFLALSFPLLSFPGLQWKWGASHPSGKVDAVVEGDASITTKNGNSVSRHGDEDDPAVKIKQGKNSVIKLAHELDGVDPEASGSGAKEDEKEEEEEDKSSKKPASKSKKPASKKSEKPTSKKSEKPASKANPASTSKAAAKPASKKEDDKGKKETTKKPASKKKEEAAPPVEGTRKSTRSNKGTHSAPQEDEPAAATGTKRKAAPASKEKKPTSTGSNKKAKA
ncbi:hypothetical protein BDY24DRAFT_372641 [Mrakia frigida]|uniref:uncharacterized protein n=1 Tax=Mrakia frigida TaxID=29902 RepID=UPI003FCC0001